MKYTTSFFLLSAVLSSGQLTVNSSSNASALVDSLLGPRMEAFGSPILVSDPSSAGTFSGGNSVFTNGTGFNSGIVLSSGAVTDIVGPNSQSGTGSSLGIGGNSLLDSILADTGSANMTFDATSLTFQFETTATASLNFNFIFASDEYNEFVGSTFNDVFAFILTPDAHPENSSHDAGASYNLAVIPNDPSSPTVGATSGVVTDGTVISVNNVNNGANASSYVDNDVNGTAPPATSENHEFDGRTVSLTAVYENLPVGIHEISLLIADAGDGILDSAVFLEQDTFYIIPNSPLPFAFESVTQAGVAASFRDLNSRLLRARVSHVHRGRSLFEEGESYDGVSDGYEELTTMNRTFERRLRFFGSVNNYSTVAPGFNGLTTVVPEADINLFGGTLGAEYTITEFFKLGVGYIRSSGDVDLGQYESMDVEFNAYAFYASYYQPLTQSVHLYADALYGIVDGDLNTERDFEEFGTTRGSGSSDSDYFEGNIGINFHSNELTHGPMVSFHRSETDLSSIQESGFASQTYSSLSLESQRVRMGYQATLHRSSSVGEISWQLRAAYETESEDDSRLVDGVDYQPDSSALIGGAGVLWGFDSGSFMAADWEGRFADKADSHHFLVRAGFNF